MTTRSARLIVLSAIVFAGCSAARPPVSASIALKGIAYVPASVTIRAGGSVTWTDEENVTHTVTGKTLPFDRELNMGGTFTFTFDRPGTFAFYCRKHPANMQGTVTVR